MISTLSSPSEVEAARRVTQERFNGILRLRFAPLRMTFAL